MQLPLQVVLKDIDRSEALEARIRADAAKLEHFHARIVSCRVTVDEEHRHKAQGREFSVHIEVRVPGREEIVSTRKHHEDVYVAVRDAFDAARRQLEEAVAKS